MSTPKRKREVQVNFRVSPEELALIEQKMSQLGTKNREAYLRKMALDGYVVQLDLPELKELVSLLRRSSNNLNQLTRRVHETGRVYDADLEDIAQIRAAFLVETYLAQPDPFAVWKVVVSFIGVVCLFVLVFFSLSTRQHRAHIREKETLLAHQEE